MSDTPRTDKANHEHTINLAYENCYSVVVDFARELEQENASLKAEVERLRNAIRTIADIEGEPEYLYEIGEAQDD